LDPTSEKILIQTFLKEYIETHANTLIQMENSGLIHMIKNEKYDEIALMHDLFSKVPDAFTILGKNLAAYIVNEGNKLV
jgi:cullin 3